jgi:hypothetical protein
VIEVYGIGRPGLRLPRGVEARVVTHGVLAAVVADRDAPPRSRADVDRHARVQGAIAAEATLVPLRFGTLVDDEAALREGLLEAHAEELGALLSELDGCVQMTLKALYHEGVPLREAVRSEPALKREADLPGGRDHRLAVGRRIAAAVEARRSADEAELVARLEPSCERVLVEEPGHELIAARLQLLVARDRRAALDAAVAVFTEQQAARMIVRYVGPLAPYSFCDLALGAGAVAWG